MGKLQHGQVNEHRKASPGFSIPGAIRDLGRDCFFISPLDGEEAGAVKAGAQQQWVEGRLGVHQGRLLFQEGESRREMLNGRRG